MRRLFEANDERTLLVATVPDLEAAIRNVVSELLAEKQESDADEKVSRTATAKRLHKTPMTLTRWEQAGKIHPIRVGRTIYYSEKEVRAIEQGKR
jgi:hypothetical protein